MSLVPSLLQAIVQLDGEALVMHVGDKPYVVSPTGQVDLASRGLSFEAVVGVVNQLLPVEAQQALDEFGAAQYELPPVAEFPGEHFTIVAARGGDDVWAEVRRRKVSDDDRVPMEFFAPSSEAATATAVGPSSHYDEPPVPVGATSNVDADDDLALPDGDQLFAGDDARNPAQPAVDHDLTPPSEPAIAAEASAVHEHAPVAPEPVVEAPPRPAPIRVVVTEIEEHVTVVDLSDLAAEPSAPSDAAATQGEPPASPAVASAASASHEDAPVVPEPVLAAPPPPAPLPVPVVASEDLGAAVIDLTEAASEPAAPPVIAPAASASHEHAPVAPEPVLAAPPPPPPILIPAVVSQDHQTAVVEHTTLSGASPAPVSAAVNEEPETPVFASSSEPPAPAVVVPAATAVQEHVPVVPEPVLAAAPPLAPIVMPAAARHEDHTAVVNVPEPASEPAPPPVAAAASEPPAPPAAPAPAASHDRPRVVPEPIVVAAPPPPPPIFIPAVARQDHDAVVDLTELASEPATPPAAVSVSASEAPARSAAAPASEPSASPVAVSASEAPATPSAPSATEQPAAPAFAAAPERPAARVAAPATEPPAPAVVAPAASGSPERPRVAPEPFVLAVPPPPPPIFIPAMPSQRRRTPLVSQPAATSSPSSPDGFAPAAPEPRFVVPPKEPVFAAAAAPNVDAAPVAETSRVAPPPPAYPAFAPAAQSNRDAAHAAAEPSFAPAAPPPPAFVPAAQFDAPSAVPEQRFVPPSSQPAFAHPAPANFGAAEPESRFMPLPAVVLPLARNPIRADAPPPLAEQALAGLDRLLRLAAARGASTLYLSSASRPTVRVDGDIHTLDGAPVLAPNDVESLLLTLMPERSAEALRTGVASEWICDVPEVGRVRCMSFRDHRGPGGVFRMMPSRAVTADQLGLSRDIQALAVEPEGLLLVSGPRSSGKRTLMSALVDLINRTRRDHVISIESEINIVHERNGSFISQREVRGGIEEMVAVARAALREDPDILVLEELRSPALMDIALDAASAGQLVIGGIPAHDASGAVDRIIDLYPPEHRRQVQLSLAQNLRGVVAQVLLRKTGGGRVAAREVLLNTAAVASVLAEGRTSQLPLAIEGGRRQGMVPLNDALVGFVQSGVVDVAEAYRRAADRAAFLALVKRQGIDTSAIERYA